METIEKRPPITMERATDLFHEMLDDTYTPVKFGNCEWPMSRVLPAMDFIMYREELNHFLNYLSEQYYIEDL